MTIKLPAVTVYESVPTKSELAHPLSADPDPTAPSDPSIELIEPDFKSIVQRFNRVLFLVDGASAGEFPHIHLTSNNVQFDETLTEALKRLQDEFAELEELYNRDNDGLQKEHVDSLRELLTDAQEKLSASTSASSDTQETSSPSVSQHKQPYLPADLAKMSERLATIATAIGEGVDTSKSFTQPLEFVVDELALRLDAIPSNTPMNPELNVALTQLQEYNKQNIKDENTAKINEIYETLNRWNSEGQTLPLVLERLRHCAALSEQAESFLDNREELAASADAVLKALKSVEGTAEEVEKVYTTLLDLFKTVSKL